MCTSDLQVWDTPAVRVVGSPDSNMVRSSPAAQTSDIGAGKVVNDTIEEAPAKFVENDSHVNEVSMIPFDTRKDNRKAVQFTMSQVDEATNPLRIVSQEQENELMESLISVSTSEVTIL